MMGERTGERPPWSRILLPTLASLCAVAIFIFDTVTELEVAVAVLYVAVVLMAIGYMVRLLARFARLHYTLLQRSDAA